jgi:hypothetical protein
MIIARKWGYGDASDPKRRVRLRSCLRPTPAFAQALRRGKSAQQAEASAFTWFRRGKSARQAEALARTLRKANQKPPLTAFVRL